MNSNAAIARRWFDEVWVAGGEVTVDQLMAPTAVGWMEGAVVKGPADFKDARRLLLIVFPDLRITVEDTIEQDARVAVRWSAQATHRGDGLGVAPTNRVVSFRGITWLELHEGKIVKGWDSWNLGALIDTLRQPVSE